ncbi:MAG: hypothetical protein ABI051_01395 [Vicinamibacterales bacterium]
MKKRTLWPAAWLLGAMLLAPQSTVERATGERLLDVRANYCNLTDPQGRIIYTPMIGGLDAVTRRAWYSRMAGAGATHVVFGPAGSYVDPANPWPAFDFWNDLPRFRALVLEALGTRSADGRGFRPVLFIGPDAAPRARIDRDWPRLAESIRDLLPFVILVPGWEPVTGGWRSAELSYALTRGRAIFGPESHWFAHFSPGRFSGQSDPPDADDPWKGDAREFWRSAGGEHVEGLLFQTPHGAAVLGPCARSVDDGAGRGLRYPAGCWKESFESALSRVGAGQCVDPYGQRSPCDWPKRRVVLFETVAYEAFRGKATDADARRIATEADSLCRAYAVRCGFGNGVPQAPGSALAGVEP